MKYLLMACFSLMLHTHANSFESYIETIDNFPKEGIKFKWYPKLLKDPEAFRQAILTFKEHFKNSPIDAICGLDSRGFVFGSALAYEMQLPFVMIRKAGKLPKEVERIKYDLEYGSACFEIETDSLEKGSSVLIIDDIMATGGTARAACKLIEKLGAKVSSVACLIELEGLGGAQSLECPFYSIMSLPCCD